MVTSTSFFQNLSTQSLSRLSAQIADLQSQVSSGKKDPRPSADLSGALHLSAARDQQGALNRYASNLNSIQSRLANTDDTLQEATNVMRRIGELALLGLSDTTSADQKEIIATEVKVLRQGFVDLANSRDDTGRALFGGFSTRHDPFIETSEGVVFQGDAGVLELKVSETLSLQSGLNGLDVFRAASSESPFEVVDNLVSALDGGASASGSATSSDSLELNLSSDRDAQEWSLVLTGPNGSSEISFVAAQGALTEAVHAINAATGITGVSASHDPAAGSIRLSAAGDITVSDVRRGDGAAGILIETRDAQGETSQLTSEGGTKTGLLERLRAAEDHLVDQRAKAGALAAEADRQVELVTERQTNLEVSISGLEDLDLAEALTRLQHLLLTRDASQQTYVKITERSLFDFIR